jgi:hypothetical protein
MEEEYYIIAKWAQEDLETLYNLANNNNNNNNNNNKSIPYMIGSFTYKATGFVVFFLCSISWPM